MNELEAYNYLKASIVLNKYNPQEEKTIQTLWDAIEKSLNRIDNLKKENFKLKEKIKKLRRKSHAKNS